MAKKKIRRGHWLGIEILIGVLIVIVLLNMLRFPVTEQATVTEEEPIQTETTSLESLPYNETTCTMRDYRFEINEEGIYRTKDRVITFNYTIKNQESKSGEFRYKMGVAQLGVVTIAKRSGTDYKFDYYTPEKTVVISGNSKQEVSIPLQEQSTANPIYGEIVVYPPQLEECKTSTKYKEVEVPAVETSTRTVEKTTESKRYESLWQKMFGSG